MHTTVVKRVPGIGHGRAMAHHGELLQGMFSARRALVTLPCDLHSTHASFEAKADSGEVIVVPSCREKARRAAELTLIYLDQLGWGGLLHIESNVPLQIGFGSSTSDVCATIRAVGNAFRVSLTPEEVAQLAVKAEVASDAIMFGTRAVLFAQREGVVLENFGGNLPCLEILGFNTDATDIGIDTLALPPAEYSWQEQETFRVLWSAVRRAIATGDLRLLGYAASASARINQAYVPKPHFDQLESLRDDLKAVGLQIAHSGSLAGLIFDPNTADLARRLDVAKQALGDLGFTSTWRFRTSRGPYQRGAGGSAA